MAGGAPKGAVAAVLPPGGLLTAEASGTCTIALHCGHDARLPAAETATLSVRPQFVQVNSMLPVAGPVDVDIVWKIPRTEGPRTTGWRQP